MFDLNRLLNGRMALPLANSISGHPRTPSPWARADNVIALANSCSARRMRTSAFIAS